LKGNIDAISLKKKMVFFKGEAERAFMNGFRGKKLSAFSNQ